MVFDRSVRAQLILHNICAMRGMCCRLVFFFQRGRCAAVDGEVGGLHVTEKHGDWGWEFIIFCSHRDDKILRGGGPFSPFSELRKLLGLFPEFPSI